LARTNEEKMELVVDILNQCKRFSTDALTKYIHKINIFQTDLSLDEVHVLHQKIDIVLGELGANTDRQDIHPC